MTAPACTHKINQTASSASPSVTCLTIVCGLASLRCGGCRLQHQCRLLEIPLSCKLGGSRTVLPFDTWICTVVQKELEAFDIAIETADEVYWIFASNIGFVWICPMGEEKFCALKARFIDQSMMKEGASIEAAALVYNRGIGRKGNS